MVFSLHVGCDDLDETAYPTSREGYSLPGEVRSATVMRDLVARVHAGAESVLLGSPTAALLIQVMSSIVKRLRSGDLFIFSFHGHGAWFDTPIFQSGPLPSSQKPEIPPNRLDNRSESTILLRDRMFLSNEYGRIASSIPLTARHVAIIDSCNSAPFGPYLETHSPMFGLPQAHKSAMPVAQRQAQAAVPPSNHMPLGRSVNNGIAGQAIFDANPNLYRPLISAPAFVEFPTIHLSACESGQVTYVSRRGSLFTNAIRRVLAAREQWPSYRTLCLEVTTEIAEMAGSDAPTPQLYAAGTSEAIKKGEQYFDFPFLC